MRYLKKSMSTKPEFPTSIHRRAAEAIVDFSMGLPVEAVLLVNSRARGTATPESDLDIALLIDPELTARQETVARPRLVPTVRERFGIPRT